MVDSTPMGDPTNYLRPEEVDAILEHTTDPRFRMLFFLLYKTGRRVSEITGDKMTNSGGLKLEDILFEEGMIYFTILKKKPMKNTELSKEQRLQIRLKMTPTKVLLPVNREVMNQLFEYVKYIRTDRLFPFTRQRVHQVFNASARKAGITKKVHIHQLRHSFAIRLAKVSTNPSDLIKLKELLVHSDIKQTQQYLKYSIDDIRELVDKV